MTTSSTQDNLSNYSIYPSFPCTLFLQGEKYKDCCCKLEAKDTWFSLVHLIGFPKSDVKIYNALTGEEVVL